MSATATVTVDVCDTSMAIALVFVTMHFTSILTTVIWNFVRGISSQDIISTAMVILFSKSAIIDFGSKGSWTEASCNEGMTLKRSTISGLSTALACTLVILLTRHAFTAIFVAISTARLTFCLRCPFCLFTVCNWHFSFSSW